MRLLLLLLAVAHAHHLPERKRVVLSVSPGEVEILVAYTLPSGTIAEGIRASLDANRDGRIAGPLERLALAQHMLPRATRGLDFGRELKLVRSDFKDAEFKGRQTGFRALLLYKAPLKAGRLALKIAKLEHEVSVEAQSKTWRILASSLPRRPKDPVWGPTVLGEGEVWLKVGP